MFTEHLGGGSLTHNFHHQTPRGFACGRGGGRGDPFRRSSPNFEDDMASNNGEIPIHTPPTYSNHFEEDDEEPQWNLTHHFLDPNQTRQQTTHPRTGKLKLEMSSFDGYLHIEYFLDWLDNVDDYLSVWGLMNI